MDFIKSVISVVACLAYTNFMDRSMKMNLTYDLSGLAVVRAVCALRRSSKEVTFYQNRNTRALHRNWTHHKRLGGIVLKAERFVDTTVRGGK